MRVVYAVTTTTVTSPRGIPVQVTWGSHWPADDPVVTAHPELFTTDPTPGLRVSEPRPTEDRSPVEQATAAPGERRVTPRRPRHDPDGR